MRLVVGPLPASVYWRRRALVLGGAVLIVALIVYSCSASSGNSANPTPPVDPTTTTASPPAAPASQPAATSPQPVTATAGAVTSSPPPAVTDAQTCTDAELLVTAAPAQATVAKGSELLIRLYIKNTSQRACNRDIGPDQQELYIVFGTERVWSSDHCDGPTGGEMRTFPPAHERSYEVVWNGHSSSSCAASTKRTPNGPVPDAGEYQLFGRVGTDLSTPITLKIT